ncbi:MAG: GNAT family N-acetyltransferase [Nostoc sp. DedVER02]|uniref:GNAT family N-acetyltransferase n=1 Tax=unclassified Nostoc TaxID=2593658 RepID=UPI002AD29E43|nr:MULTISPECIES: GNAT family N-acetyltransferase [unclassified Nostoc]MDZ7987307.1 GNAT family N-acetyltransferase [Nostoc sp. DedVER02]MDZ8110815.1 GNAT family N-acetyltransferase [Nostoc sp. DedVER01b]
MNGRNISIRDAQQKDIPTIMELIYLKAKFDGCPKSVEATPQKLKIDLFGEKPLAFVLLAKVDGDAIGLATYHFIYSTFLAKPGIWLDDLYVKSEHRNHRVGQALMLRLREIGQEKGCGRIDWTVAVSNERGIKFYERIGAKIMNKVKLCRLDGQALSQ